MRRQRFRLRTGCLHRPKRRRMDVRHIPFRRAAPVEVNSFCLIRTLTTSRSIILSIEIQKSFTFFLIISYYNFHLSKYLNF